MRILLVSPYFPPRNATGSLRAHAFARCWAEAGERVTVLTTRKPEHQRGLEAARDGLEVVEIGYPVPRLLARLRNTLRAEPGRAAEGAASGSRWRRTRGLLRSVQERTGVFGSMRMPDFTDRWVRPAAAWAIREARWDLIFSSAGPYTAHLVALRVKRRHPAARWVQEYRDLWVDNPLARGLFPFTLRERRLERQCLRCADLLVTVSEPLARRLAARSAAPVEVVYNGFDEDELERLPPGGAFPADGLVRLVFTGTVYPRGQDAGPFFEAAAALWRESPDGSRLRLAVCGPAGGVWRALAAHHGVGDLVEDRGTVSHDEARRMQRDADGLLLVDFRRGIPGVLTGKIFEYIGATAPIIVVGGDAGSPIGTMVRRCGRGVHLGDDPRAIAGALRALVRGGGPAAGPPDRGFIRTLTRLHQARRLHRRLLDLAGPPPVPAAAPGATRCAVPRARRRTGPRPPPAS